MIATYIDGCFGVLHQADGNRGVLICGPVGDEALNSYRALVFLAEALADAGFPTLRLDYRGCGDSAGVDAEPDRIGTWLRCIETAATWLREQCAVQSVTIIGVRIGAALASQARTGADSLVLLLPTGGRRFVNELTMAAQINQRVWKTRNRIDDGTWFEAHGVRLDLPSRDALKTLDVAVPAATPVLVVDAVEGPVTRAIAQRPHSSGARIDVAIDEDAAIILRDSHLAAVPRDVFARIVGWTAALPSAPRGAGRPRPDGGTLELGSARETPVRFGPAGALFGILCTPAHQPADTPVVLLANTGANPRFGNARVGVDLARRLAAEGIATLRMDGSGMGDAAPASGELGQPYSEAATSDVCHGIAELHQRFGRTVIVIGTCSGAYHALQAALRDARVGGLVLVNLQRFVWREGDPPDAIRRSALRPTQFYLRHIFDPQSWRRMFAGDFDVLNLIRVVALRMVQRGIAGLDPVIALTLGRATRVGRVRRSLRSLSFRGVPILYVLSNNDPGVEELAGYFGTGGWRLLRLPNVTLRLLENSDHTLSSHRLRVALIEEIAGWFQRLSGVVEPGSRVLSEPPAAQGEAGEKLRQQLAG